VNRRPPRNTAYTDRAFYYRTVHPRISRTFVGSQHHINQRLLFGSVLYTTRSTLCCFHPGRKTLCNPGWSHPARSAPLVSRGHFGICTFLAVLGSPKRIPQLVSPPRRSSRMDPILPCLSCLQLGRLVTSRCLCVSASCSLLG